MPERGSWLRERASDGVEHEGGLFEDHVVRKAEHGDPQTPEVVVASDVTERSADVRFAVGLDGEPSGDAEEVGEVAADGVLPPELESGEFPITQQEPEAGLGGRWLASKGARAERFTRVELRHAGSSTHDEDRLRGIDISFARFIFRAMRGVDSKQASMLCLLSPETVVPANHPIRSIKKLVDAALADLTA